MRKSHGNRQLLVDVLPCVRASIDDRAPSSTHGEWEVFSFEMYFYGRNAKKPEMEFLTPDFQANGEALVLKGGSAYAWGRGTWITTAPETMVRLKGGMYHSDGKVRITKYLFNTFESHSSPR